MTYQIYIVDDHPVIRDLYVQMIGRSSDLTVCGVAATAGEALSALATLQPNLVIVDVGLPDMSGLELLRRLREQTPELPILVISGQDEDLYYARQALLLGAQGYLDKLNLAENLLKAIRHVLAGGIFVCKSVREKLLKRNPDFASLLTEERVPS
jgi:DNA-binding NarL/FixJ family response regulator